MNIAIDISQMCYPGTGVARYLRGLTSTLLTIPSSHHFTLYAGTLKKRSFFTALSHTLPWSQATWKIFPLSPKLAGYVLNRLPIPFELLTGPVDVIHTSDWSEPFSHFPKVTTVHDLVFKRYPSTVDPLIRSTQTNRLANLVKGTTHLVADSQSTKDDLMKIYGIPASRITVIYPGIEPQFKPADQTAIARVQAKYHLPKEYYLTVGTEEPRKNLSRLIEAMKTLPIPLVATGNYGWGHAVPQDKLIKTGFVAELDLPALYSGARAFVYPSLYEGFGFPVLEAMACGTPVVTSNISSLPEVGGTAAVLVEPQSVEAIRTGIKTAEEGHIELIQAGIKQARKFTWEKTAQAMMEVYEKISHQH